MGFKADAPLAAVDAGTEPLWPCARPPWPEATPTDCEPDVDACDGTGDAPLAWLDIQQVWSRREGDRFIITTQQRAPWPPEDEAGDGAGGFVMFDRNGDLDDPEDTDLNGWCTWPPPPDEIDNRLVVVTYEASFAFSYTATGPYVLIDRSVAVTCDDLAIRNRFVVISVPFDDIVDADGIVRYALTFGAGTGEPTYWDLAGDGCHWLTSRGGSPDVLDEPIYVPPCTEAPVMPLECDREPQ